MKKLVVVVAVVLGMACSKEAMEPSQITVMVGDYPYVSCTVERPDGGWDDRLYYSAACDDGQTWVIKGKTVMKHVVHP